MRYEEEQQIIGMKRLASVLLDIGSTSGGEVATVFGGDVGLWVILKHHDSVEIVEKWDEYKKKSLIKVGTEIVDSMGYHGVVTGIVEGTDNIDYRRKDGRGLRCPVSDVVPTGRYFISDLSNLLSMIGESE